MWCYERWADEVNYLVQGCRDRIFYQGASRKESSGKSVLNWYIIYTNLYYDEDPDSRGVKRE